ncbi:unnamed protein product [Cyclocybe aegerita]|uniref:Beta-catenin-like protein 1 N-terminal domain-containing protein n=1 Tax=Cyclocybe aegerita TaxID=1973307 RepID=A0A8S0W2J7_CYCAE|nr:unnamed protein product [Cyclocybe aegerita]
MDIDKMFKVPKLPTGGTKRKLPENPTPEMLKKMKMDSNTLPKPSETVLHPSRKATVEEVVDEDEDEDFAPGGDADYFAEEDDEGRFFGGGLTSEQKEILNIFDQAGTQGTEDEAVDLSITRIRQILLSFERAVNRNQDHRSKYPDDPSKFIDSEADLDSAIKALLPLSQVPSLAFPELVRSGAVTLLVGLLTHENVDIMIDAVEVIYELTDDDLEVEQEEEGSERGQEALTMFVEKLVDSSVLELLADNLNRLNEDEESDRQGVFHLLGIFENFVGLNPALSPKIVTGTGVLKWLLSRIQAKIPDENRGYAAELLSILLQDSHENKGKFTEVGGVDVLLKTLSQYRRRDPIDADETEFMDNLFDSLCSSLSEPATKQAFLEGEGPDLMVLLMKEKLESRSRSIKVLDYAMSGSAGTPVCEAFVEVLGLKTLFTAFMGKSSKHQRSGLDSSTPQDVAHSLGIISSLFTNLPSDTTSRIRLLAKFVEGDYAKIDKLLEIRDAATKRLQLTEIEIQKSKQDASNSDDEESHEDSLYLQRLDGGLFTLQTVDYILAWLMMEDDGGHVLRMLNRKDQSTKDILRTLQSYEEHLGNEIDSTQTTDDSMSQKDILKGLISALSSNTTKQS